MAKIQAVWALDVGQAALKALKLVPGETPDQVLAEAFDYVEYPKILSQPDADPEQLVREAFETFLERNDLKGCRVAIGVPGQAGLVKFIKLPPVEKKRIPDIVKFEARQQIPFALEEVVWAYQQIGDEEEGGDEDFTMAEVGLFAMKRDQISKAILPFTAAGIEVDIVQMGPIALYNFITFDQLKGSENKDSVVLLDIGADHTDLIITDGTRIWQRNVPIGGNHFTRALTKELKQTFAKAEHLKRNATKAPDPRSIFTAMRGVFNDFASEINRSIGFYSSVNRMAKISKIIGMGNGFKLPGLQKFLQQNLNQEVEKLETFARMVGDEVKTAPQFSENLPSFAVAYGLAIQGLGRSALRTNLLPPEIEQVRLIRAKKPWALAASALFMLGFSALFLGDYRVLAKVSTDEFKSAVNQAKGTSQRGAQYKTEYDAAKAEWNGKNAEGKALVADPKGRGMWADFLKTVNGALPNPAVEYKLDPTKPENQPKLDKLRVHIDAIKPVWREDVGKDWFDTAAAVIPDNMRNLMHPYDRANPPKGPGWIVQVVGHHYNPAPASPEERRKSDKERLDFGPIEFIVKKILPRFTTIPLRNYGINHVALTWLTIDKDWTNEKAGQTNGLASNTVPILDRASPPASESAAGSNPMDSMMKSAYGKGGQPGYPGGMPGGYPGGANPYMMNPYNNMGQNGLAGQADKKDILTLTRTDFLIQFIWQPPEADAAAAPKTPEEAKAKAEELAKKDEELAKKVREAEKNSAVVMPSEADVLKTSLQKSQEVATEISKAQGAAPGTPGAPGQPAVAPVPGPAGSVPPGVSPAVPPGAGPAPAPPGTTPAQPK